MDDLINRTLAIATLVMAKETGSLKCEELKGVIKVLNRMPSAQPEILRCKDCTHNQLPATSANANCEIYYGMTDQYGFCHMAERREVENERSD